MKRIIRVFLITLITCSNFIEHVNLRSTKNKIITEYVDYLSNFMVDSFEKTLKGGIYLFSNSNSDKIKSDISNITKIADKFLKKNNFKSLVSLEKKVIKQLNHTKINSQAIEAYFITNQYPNDFIQIIKTILMYVKNLQIERFFIPIFTELNNNKKSIIEMSKSIDIGMKGFKQQIEKSIDSLSMQNITQLFDSSKFTKILKDNLPNFTKSLKTIFPSLQSLFKNKSKYDELKKNIGDTFFNIKNIASKDEFDLYIIALQKLVKNLFATIQLFIYELFSDLIINFYSDVNIFLHKSNKVAMYQKLITSIEQIFSNYNLDDLVNDLKSAINSMEKFPEKFNQKKFEKNLITLKKKIKEMNEDDMKPLIKQLFNYIKTVINS